MVPNWVYVWVLNTRGCTGNDRRGATRRAGTYAAPVLVLLAVVVVVGLVVYWRLRDTIELWNLRDYWARKRTRK